MNKVSITLLIGILLMMCFQSTYTKADALSTNLYEETIITNVPQSFIEGLTDIGITWTSESVLSIQEVVAQGSKNTVFVITTVIDDQTVKKEYILEYDNSADLINANIADVTSPMTRATGTGSYSHSAFTIVASATYDVVWNGNYAYYRPQNVSFYYKKKASFQAGTFSVQCRYQAMGCLLKYPSFELTNSAYSHQITVQKTNPVANQIYRKYNALGSLYVIDTGTGPFQCHDLRVSGLYNGVSFESFIGI